MRTGNTAKAVGHWPIEIKKQAGKKIKFDKPAKPAVENTDNTFPAANIYFHGQGIIPVGVFDPRKTIESSQVLGFLVAWASFEMVIS